MMSNRSDILEYCGLKPIGSRTNHRLKPMIPTPSNHQCPYHLQRQIHDKKEFVPCQRYRTGVVVARVGRVSA